jgi:type I restriction enzyme S subunit
MNQDLKPYPEYKHSGVPWLGEVPQHWRVVKVREVARVINGFPFDSGRFSATSGHPVIRIRDLNKSQTATRFDGPFVNAARVEPGEVLVGMDGDFNVGIWRGTETALLNQRMCCVRAACPVTTHLLRYVLPAPLKEINDVTWSTTVKHLASSQVERIEFGIPPDDEQSAIVRFLDYADRRIRRYIRAKRKMIALLNEQKQAIIHRAVTRGLDPNVRLKPSGVEWLGDVPENWEVVRLGALLRERGETNDDGRITQVLSVLRNIGVIRYEDKGNIGNKKSEDTTRYKVVRPNDVVVNCMNVIIGSVGLSRYTGCLSPVYYVLVRRSKADDPQYLNALFQCSSFHKSLARIGNGILAHRMRIPMELLKCELLPRPPADDQASIVRALGSMTSGCDKAIARAEREIDLLREYRTRLIADVVTGKLDVREAAAGLPDETEEPEPLDDAGALTEGDLETEDMGLDAAEEAEA